MSNTRFLQLISKKFSGKASLNDISELEQLVADNEELKEKYMLLNKYWEHEESVNQIIIEEGLQKVLTKLNLPQSIAHQEEKTFSTRKMWLRIAVAATVIIAAGYFVFFKTASKSQFFNKQNVLVEKQNVKGVKSTIELNDGSKIWLNADSKIQYPQVFSGNSREVYLSGEAFFEVKKNPAKPFIIHLANGTIKVIGTSFNVRAYANEKVVETSVSTGKVAFIPKYSDINKVQDTVFLSPDSKAKYQINKEKVITETTISYDDKAWTEGKLIFKGLTFEQIALQLERNFGKKTIFISDEARKYKLTGSFENNSLEEIIFYLSKSKGFNYKITNTQLLIADKATDIPE